MDFLGLDQPLEMTKELNAEIRVVLVRGSSKRDAARLSHQRAAREIIRIFGEVYSEQVTIIKLQTSTKWFMAECTSYEVMLADKEFEGPDALEEPLRGHQLDAGSRVRGVCLHQGGSLGEASASRDRHAEEGPG